MANYQSDVFGVIAKDTSSPVGASTPSGITILTVALDDTKVYDSVSDYIIDASDAAASTVSSVVMDTSRDIGVNELAGQYLWVDGLTQGYLISSHTSAVSGASFTVTLEDELPSELADTDIVKIRKFKGFKYPTRHASLSSFLDTYFSKTTDGDYDITTSEVGYYALRSYARNGGSVFYIIPVEYSDTKATLLSNLTAVSDATVMTELAKFSDSNFMVCPKGYVPDTAISSSEWQTLDGAYVDYCINRAINTSGDKRRMHYLYSVPSATVSAAVTYMSTFNKNSYRTSSIFPWFKVSPKVGIDLIKICSASAYAGLAGKVHKLSDNKEGQPVAGVQDSQLADIVKNGVEIVRSDLANLQASQVNAIVDFNGFYIHSNFTNFTTNGRIERSAHLIHASNRLSNACIAFAETYTQKPNKVQTRNIMKGIFERICQAVKDDGAIEDFTVEDLTSLNDVQNNQSTWKISILHNSINEFIDITFSSALGEL